MRRLVVFVGNSGQTGMPHTDTSLEIHLKILHPSESMHRHEMKIGIETDAICLIRSVLPC